MSVDQIRDSMDALATQQGGSSVAPTARNYFSEFLQDLGVPVTQANLNALYGVAQLEGWNDRYNPLNVIQPEPGSVAFNSVGVQTYADFDTGVQGAVALFQGSHWTGVRAALARGDSTADVLAAFKAAYTWDPSVQFPTGRPSWGKKLIGPKPGSGTLPVVTGSSGSSGSGSGGATLTGATTNFPGGSADPLNWPGEILGAAAGGVLKVLLPFVTKAVFVIGGLALVVVGLDRAAKPAEQPEQTEPAAAA